MNSLKVLAHSATQLLMCITANVHEDLETERPRCANDKFILGKVMYRPRAKVLRVLQFVSGMGWIRTNICLQIFAYYL
jgi:hypothetical protein